MNHISKFLIPPRKALATLLIPALLLSSSGYSQEQEEVVELSPFEVDGSGDVGYQASSTLAGTRLNSNLTDVAAAISPFTKEFINDIGADSIEDLLAYSNNAVRMDETELANDNQVLEFEFQFNIRGLPATRARNYFTMGTVSMDNFNVERVDESRGPNSILFGIGSAGGVINTSTKRARFTDINEVQVMFGSNSQVRGSFDFNRELIEDKLALRVNAMWDNDETWRQWEYKDQQRFHIASTWKVAENTTLRAEFEDGTIDDNLGRSYLGRDYTSYWIDAGSVTRPGSTSSQGQRNNVWINRAQDNATFFSGNFQGPHHTNRNGGQVELMSESSALIQNGVLSWENNPGGPDNIRESNYTTWSVYLEQRIGRNFNIEAAFNRLENDFLQYDSGSNGYYLRGDVTDPGRADSPANDRSGEYFYETNWTRRTRDRTADTARVTASYELELPHSWGRHRFAALIETQDANAARESAFQQLTDAIGVLYVPTAPGAASTNGRNRIWQRNYITPGDASTYQVGSWRNPVSVDLNGTNYTDQWLPVNQNVQDDDVRLDSMLVSMQNFWLSDKVITTFGYRQDDIKISKRSPTTDPNNQRIVVDYDTPPEVFNYDGGETTTIGLVVKPTEWLSILYNDSDNQGLPDVNRLVLPDSTFADPSVGEGTDVGIMLNLMDGKLFARFAKFESSMVGLTAFGARGNVENPNNRILDTLLDAGLIDQSERDARNIIANTYTFGRDSEGYEAELTANLTDNWSARFNYSQTDRVIFNVMPEILAWYPDQDAFWRSFGDDVYFNRDANGVDAAGPYEPPSGFDSIALESDRTTRFIEGRTAFTGLGDQGSRTEQANMFTNYRFTEGPLKGFNIGGGVRYLGPMVVNVDLATESLLYGNSKTTVDFLMGYRRKAPFFGKDAVVKFQLNVRNLFDETDFTVAGRELDGRLQKISLQTPREFQFRTTFNF